ncbi:MAG: hypothetical protein EP329_24505, partial [Deltaproteobacteria bacterium]
SSALPSSALPSSALPSSAVPSSALPSSALPSSALPSSPSSLSPPSAAWHLIQRSASTLIAVRCLASRDPGFMISRCLATWAV